MKLFSGIKVKYFLLFFIAFISNISLNITYSLNDSASSFTAFFASFSGWGIKNLIIICVLVFIYNKVLMSNKFNKRFYFISLFFALLMITGMSYKLSASSDLIWKGKTIIKSISFLIGYSFLFYVIIWFLFDIISKVELSKGSTDKGLIWKNALIIFGSWFIVLLVAFPGTFWFDCIEEIRQFFGAVKFNNMNPFLQTILLGSFIKLGHLIGYDNFGVFLYCIVQMFFLSIIFSYSIFWIRKIGFSNKIKNILLGVYIFNPIFPLYAISVGKDTNWGATIVLFIIFIFEMMFDIEEFFKSKSKIIILVLDLILMCLLRNAGLALVLVCIPIVLYLSKKKFLIRVICVYVIVLSFVLSWNNFLLPFMNVSVEGNQKENLSIPFQQTARYVKYYENEVTLEERLAINKVLDYYSLAKNYNPEMSDPVKSTFKNNCTYSDIAAYNKVYLAQFTKHPFCYIEAIINKSYGYFYPDDEGREKKYYAFGITYISKLNAELGLKIHPLSKETIELMHKVLDSLRNIPIYGLMTSVGFYTWCLILFIGLVYNRTSKKNLLIFVPSFFVLIGCVLSPVNAYFRYELPVVMSMPFMILISVYFIKSYRI